LQVILKNKLNRNLHVTWSTVGYVIKCLSFVNVQVVVPVRVLYHVSL